MTNTARKLATYEDLEAFPEDVHAEIAGGEIVTMPSGLPEHGYTVQALGQDIGGPFGRGRGGPGGWWIIPEMDVRFEAHETVRPDVSGWRRERLANPRGVRPIDVVPDWIAEVVSPGRESRKRDVIEKRALYAQYGVAYYWLLDPAVRTLEALKLVDSHWLEIGVYDETAVARIAPFELIELDVGALFMPSEDDE